MEKHARGQYEFASFSCWSFSCLLESNETKEQPSCCLVPSLWWCRKRNGDRVATVMYNVSYHINLCKCWILKAKTFAHICFAKTNHVISKHSYGLMIQTESWDYELLGCVLKWFQGKFATILLTFRYNCLFETFLIKLTVLDFNSITCHCLSAPNMMSYFYFQYWNKTQLKINHLNRDMFYNTFCSSYCLAS